MNPAQLHLMLNHLPVVGALFSFALLVIGFWAGNRHVLRIGLGTALVVAGMAVPVFLTGEPVGELVENLPGVTETVIERHEAAAKVALGLVLAVGFVGLVGLIRFRERRIPRGLAFVALVMNLGAVGQMAWTAHLGGRIRHTEIRAEAALGDGAREERHELDSD